MKSQRRGRVEPEAPEPDRPRLSLERLRIVVRHGDVEGDAFEVLRGLRAADRPVVLGLR